MNLAKFLYIGNTNTDQITPCRLKDLTDGTASMPTLEDTAEGQATVVAEVEGTPHLAMAAKTTAAQRLIRLPQPKEAAMDRNTDNTAVVPRAIRYD